MSQAVGLGLLGLNVTACIVPSKLLEMSATLSLQFLRDRYPGLFGANIVTMQQFMWQLDIVGVANFVMD
jgi:hypothetical protein